MLKICSLQKIRPPEMASHRGPNGTWWLTGNGQVGGLQMTNRPDADCSCSMMGNDCQVLSVMSFLQAIAVN
jgi:hypothetical protein